MPGQGERQDNDDGADRRMEWNGIESRRRRKKKQERETKQTPQQQKEICKKAKRNEAKGCVDA